MSNRLPRTPKSAPGRPPARRLIFSSVSLVLGLILVAGFLYLDRDNHISKLVHSSGSGSVVAAILIMTVASLTPLPTEGVLLMCLKIYGATFGMIYAWTGFILGSLIAFWIARTFGSELVRSWVSRERFNTVNLWVTRRGTFGLLIVRLSPIPAFLVNYVAGILPSVSLWNYLWTSVVGIIPYYLGITLIFLGVARRDLITVSASVIGVLLIWLIGYWLQRRGRHLAERQESTEDKR